MSFENKSMWMQKEPQCLTDGEVAYDSSRTESKRGHHWFTDAHEPELFGNKKQALEAVNNRPISGISNLNVSLWENTSCFQSSPGHFTDRLFVSEPVNAIIDQNILSTGNVDIGRRGSDNQFGDNLSVGLSMSHTSEDPASRLNYGGTKNIKVNRVRESENGMSISLNRSSNAGDNSSVSMGTFYDRNPSNLMALGPNYSNGNDNAISMGPSFSKADDHLASMGHTFKKADGNFILMGHTYEKGMENILSMARSFDKGDGNFISMGEPFKKGESNTISMSHAYDKGLDEFISVGASHHKDNRNFISMGSAYNKVDDNSIISMGPSYEKSDNNFVSTCSTYGERDSSILSMGHHYSKGESHTISFGGFQDEPEINSSGTTIGNYDLVSAQALDALGQKDLVQPNSDLVVSKTSVAASITDSAKKNKELKITKKAPPNNFPSNVKSLLSTGMLDGVPVKYVSWSREKNLRGVIKGTGYLCGCTDCKLSKSLNAYEFERHAECKTKHPNNHIYFENGKTIYAVVQELKTTSQDMLFEAIQNVTGSPINQKNYRIWKASYQAATRELLRIYGKDEVVLPS